MAITCKEDLLNTYIKNDNDELLDLFISKMKEFGIKSCDDPDFEYLRGGNKPFIFCSTQFSGCGQAEWGRCGCSKYRRLTLDDFKPASPKTKPVYTPVTESIFDLKEDFEAGNLYFRWFGNPESEDSVGYDQITDENMLFSRYEEKRLLRKTEKPVEWFEEAADYLQNIRAEEDEGEITFLGCGGDFVIRKMLSKEQWIEVSKKILEDVGEL